MRFAYTRHIIATDTLIRDCLKQLNELANDAILFVTNNEKKLIKPLPKDKFVIGFKYFELFINKDRNLQNITCFHANYTIGEKSKVRRLHSIEQRINDEGNGLLLFVHEIVLKVVLKLRLLRRVYKK